MADNITINAAEFSKQANNLFKGMEKELHDGMEALLEKNARILELEMKKLAPKDIGGLAASISAPVNTAELEFTVSVNAFYAAFLEWGTGRYAAQYVSGLPEDWQAYARQFKGQKGNEGLDKFLERMIDWVRRKGLHGLTKSGRSKTGIKAEQDIYNIAYVIVIRILRHGIKPHPFMYPAYLHVKPLIIKDVDLLLKRLTQK